MLNINGITINKEKYGTNVVNKIKAILTVKPVSIDDNDETVNLYFTETTTTLTIPRYFFDNFEKIKLNETIQEDFNNIKEIQDINFNFTLRDYQIDIVKKTHEHLLNNNCGLLSVGCGRGKTIMAIKIISLLKLKTLVVVHKEFLQEQWINRIQSSSNVSIGIIQGDKCEIDGKDIVIGMIQSISKRDYGPDLNQFGLLIYDEAHHVPAKMFSLTLKKLCTKYILGLSATFNRKDGLIKVLHWYLGDFIYKEPQKFNKAVVVKKINFMSNSNKYHDKTRWIKGQHRPDMNAMLDDIISLDSRNKVILRVLYNLIDRDCDRKIIILSHRIAHLEYLKEKTDKHIKEHNLNIKTAYFIGKLNKNERRDAEDNADLFFASYDMAQEALDIPRLNTAIFATPKKDIVQTVGRIQRTILGVGDIKPLIIDIVDNLNLFKNHSRLRDKYYKKAKYLIEQYYCCDKKVVKNYEDYEKLKFDKNIKIDYDKIKSIMHVDRIKQENLEEDKNSPVEKKKEIVIRNRFLINN